MKVLLVGDYPPPTGGIATHVEQLHRFLLSRAIPTSVLDIGKGARPAPDVVPVRTRLGYTLRLLQFAARGWLLHLHVTGDNPTSWLIVGSVVAAGKLFRLPPLVTLHSGLVPSYLEQSAGRRRWARTLLTHCGRVIGVSPAIGTVLESIGVPASMVAVHPAFLASQLRPGPPPKGFASVRASYKPLLALADHRSSIYGRRIAFQALKLIARDFPGVGLALFGPGPRSKVVEAEGLAEGVRSRVHDFGELDHSAALGLISRCDAFLRPTTADGDSVSVREALGLGIRCVASDIAVRPQGAVLFRTGDYRDLADKILRALTGPCPRSETVDVGPILLEEYRRAWTGSRLRQLGGEQIGREKLQLGPP